MAISTRQVKNKRDSNGVLTGRPGTVYDVNIKYTAPNLSLIHIYLEKILNEVCR